MEPNLKEILDDVLSEADTVATKVKFFQVTADNGVVKGSGLDGKTVIEQQVNDFVKEQSFINCVQFNFQRNFLPGTVLGEYQEVWTAMVGYEE